MSSKPVIGPGIARLGNIRIYGGKDTPGAYGIRDFLQRNVVEFEWVHLTCDVDCQRALGLPHLGSAELPVVELPGGERLFAPSLHDLASRLGMVAVPQLREYDLSIYGAGPAGLSAAVYAASEGLRTVLIERHSVGGQAGTSSLIENYMGFPEGVGGAELADRARQQAIRFGAEILMMREGINADFRDGRIWVDLADGGSLVARANVCATGVEWRRLGVPDEDRFLHAGLFYGAGASEAPFCAGDHVFVVGGGNSAGQAVMHFSRHACRVTMLVRGATLAESLSAYLAERITGTPNVEVAFGVQVTGLEGDATLRRIALTERMTGITRWVDCRRLFVCVGGAPHTEWAKATRITRDALGYLVTGPDLFTAGVLPTCWALDRDPFYLETSVPGSFAAGDVRHGSVKRVASAVGEGAMAVTFVHRYLAETA